MLRFVSQAAAGLRVQFSNRSTILSHQIPVLASLRGQLITSTLPAKCMQWRSMAVFRGSFRSGSHYENDSMVNAKNPELPEDPQLAEAACRIFGTAPISNPHARSVRKLLLTPLKGNAIAEYYPPYLRHNKDGYQDPFRLRAEAKLERLKRRGKGPPKKGQGKRAMKKK